MDRARYMSRCLAILISFFLLGGQVALGDVDCFDVTPRSIVISVPTILEVPPGLSVGEYIGSPTPVMRTEGLWNCVTGRDEWAGSAAQAIVPSLGSAPGRTRGDILETGVPGLGIVVDFESCVAESGGSYNCNDSAMGQHALSLSQEYATFAMSGDPVRLGIIGRAHFIKTGPITGGVVTNTIVGKAYPADTTNGGGSPVPADGNWRFADIVLMFNTTVVGPTCTVQDVNVVMEPIESSKFSGIGSTAARKSFDVSLEDCPAGMNAISYTLTPLSEVFDPAQGVVVGSLNNVSGVGFQVTDSNGLPVQFFQPIVIGGYNSAVGGNLTIPLGSAYYQTGAEINAGTLAAALEITLSYQ